MKPGKLFVCNTVLLLFFWSHLVIGQSDLPLEINGYYFTNFEANTVEFPLDNQSFEPLFKKLDTLILSGSGRISILHIGGSHVQAGVYTNRVRERLQNYIPGLNAGYGLVFPYCISKTNTPKEYSFHTTGSWESCRNTEYKKNCQLGISGINVSTADSSATLKFSFNRNTGQNNIFNIVKVFHSLDSACFIPVLSKVKVIDIQVDKLRKCTTFLLDSDYSEFELNLTKTHTSQNFFELYGISLENGDPGILYHSAGINGASLASFLKCNLLKLNLETLNPDLVIVSLGTNDAYTTRFNPGVYESNYRNLLKMIKEAVPGSAILCIVANDSYLYRRYPNRNTSVAGEVIYKIAREMNCGVWNLYNIMGGYNSSIEWKKQNLMLNDLVHFSYEGYVLVGDLLFNALINAYNNHIEVNYNNLNSN